MKKNVVLGLIILAPFLAKAQQGSVPITFGEAFQKTLTYNPEIEAIRYEERAAEMERKAAVGLRSPKIGISGAYVHTQKDFGFYFNNLKAPVQNILGSVGGLLPPEVLQTAGAILEKDWGLTILHQNFATIGGTVSVPVFTGGKINAANRAARLNEQSARERGEQSRNSLISQLVERYYGLNLALEVIKVRQQVVDAVSVHLRDAIALEENGVIAKAERLLVEVKMAEAERELLSARLNAENIRASMCNTLNEQADYDPVSEMFVLSGIEDVAYFQQLALSCSPLLKQVELQKGLAEENVRLQRSEFMPQIAALGGASFYRYNLSNRVPKWAVGAGFTMNIFDGLSREHKYSAAKHTVKRVEALETQAENELTLAIENLYNEMTNVRERIPSIDKSREFAEEYLRIQSIGFREGVVPASDVLDAELNLASIRIEKLTVAYMYDVMFAKLLEATGISELFPSYAEGPYAQYIRYEENKNE